MRVYLDTSAVVSLFFADRHSEVASRAVSADGVVLVITDWTTLEFTSVVARFVREGRLTAMAGQELLATYGDWVAGYADLHPMTSLDLASASSAVAAMTMNLRGPDAVHLAAATRLSARLLTFDRKMAEAATALGTSGVRA